MAPKNLFKVYDPTFQFLMGSFISILFVKADDTNYSFVVRVPTMEDVKSHLLDPAVFIGLGMFLLNIFFSISSERFKKRSWIGRKACG